MTTLYAWNTARASFITYPNVHGARLFHPTRGRQFFGCLIHPPLPQQKDTPLVLGKSKALGNDANVYPFAKQGPGDFISIAKTYSRSSVLSFLSYRYSGLIVFRDIQNPRTLRGFCLYEPLSFGASWGISSKISSIFQRRSVTPAFHCWRHSFRSQILSI